VWLAADGQRCALDESDSAAPFLWHTLRHELLDHVIVLGERHLLRLVRQHVAYYNEDRPHMSLGGDAPVARAVEPPSAGEVVALPRVGGLHHRYSRAA
jgi:transposase InsO family protein